MKKYDCSKTLDYVHEVARACDKYVSCSSGCPLINRVCTNITNVTQEDIDAIQEWSDENPEAPKLTKKDRAFLEAFDICGDRAIRKDRFGNAYYAYDGIRSRLASGMFESLEADTTTNFEELLKLEVEEEE